MKPNFITLIIALCNCAVSYATNSFYQIDLLVFSNGQNKFIEESNSTTRNIHPYNLLPVSYSDLKNEHQALLKQQEYHILLNYSWLQPYNNQKSITCFNGTISVIKNNYYLFESNLLFQSPDSSFAFIKKQRLKPDIVYYFDHPHGGMLIKVHKVSYA